MKCLSRFLSGFQKLSLLFVVLGLSGCVLIAAPDLATIDAPVKDVQSQAQNAIASAHPLATEAGMTVLAEGGNAFDAAVAVAAVLAVVEPFGSGLGGGGFWLLHQAEQDESIFVDAREKAPLAATEHLYQDDAGNVNQELAINHPLAAAIPGTPAALVHVQKKYGTMALSRLLQPAIHYARQGFAITLEYQEALSMRLEAIQKWPSSSVFLQDGQVPENGWILRQPALAKTLESLAKFGRQGFYGGDRALEMVLSVRDHGGIWSLNDLHQYDVVEREPISFHVGDALITSAPLPSSGGLVMGLIFGQLEQHHYFNVDPWSQQHLFVEAMRNAYYHRALTMGDSDFTGDDNLDMLSGDVIKTYAARINPLLASSSDQLPAVTSGTKGDQTTHFSILDADGNRASVTLSINLYFGSGFVAGDSGVLLNNEMDDFSAKPGEPNSYGLVGSEANKIEPGKRPLSSMSPTFVETPSDVYIIGTPGGSRIISMVSGALLQVLQGSKGGNKIGNKAAHVTEIVASGRIHHQYLPDKIFFERGALTREAQQLLKDKGHVLKKLSKQYGDMQMIHWNKKTETVAAASDLRGEGVAIVQKRVSDE